MLSLARSPTSLIYNCIYANGVMSEQKSDAGRALELHTCVHYSSLGIWSKQQVNLIRVMSPRCRADDSAGWHRWHCEFLMLIVVLDNSGECTFLSSFELYVFGRIICAYAPCQMSTLHAAGFILYIVEGEGESHFHGARQFFYNTSHHIVLPDQGSKFDWRVGPKSLQKLYNKIIFCRANTNSRSSLTFNCSRSSG
jgi:hypothetical protein